MSAIYVLTLRQLCGRWRLLILAALSAAPLIVAALSTRETLPSRLDDVLVDGLFAAAVLPVVALAVATAAFGNELSDRTLASLTLTPVAHWRIASAKLLAAVTVGAVPLVAGAAGSVALAFHVAGLPGLGRATLAVALAMLVGVALYSTLFLWAGLVTSRPLALGLLYVFVWEGLFGTFVTGIRYLSIRQYTLGVAKAVDGTRFAGSDQHVMGSATAIVGSSLVAVIFTWLAVRRLRRMDVP